MNPYNELFTLFPPPPNEPKGEEFHEIKRHVLCASGWYEDFIPPRATKSERARWLLSKSLTGHRFDYLYRAMNNAA